MKRFWALGILVGVVLAAWPAAACNVPVFRYALERWPAAPYEVYVFHRGPLSAAHQKTIESLKSSAAVDLSVVDLADKLAEDAAKVWQPHAGAALPWMVVRYPSDRRIPVDAWSGPLADEAAALLVDSPSRQKIARGIIGGDCAVFLLVESGDRAADEAAAGLVEKELKRLQATLELPKPPDGRWDDPIYDTKGPPALKVAFSLVRVSRIDPAERLFVKIIMNSMPGLEGAGGPVLIPVFGRGRALDAWSGRDISKDMIEDACEFLVGPCSCVVKDRTPGLDLLMAVDWDGVLAGQKSAVPAVETAPLTGVSAFVAAEKDRAAPWPMRLRILAYAFAAVGAGVVILAVVGIVVWRKARSA
jgi:hypothetical protein